MKPNRSIQWQLLIWQMLLLATVLVVLLSLHYHLHKKSLIAQMDATLHNLLTTALPIVDPENDPDETENQNGPPPLDRPYPPPFSHPAPMGAPKAALQSEDDLTFLENLKQKNCYLLIWNPDGSLKHHYGVDAVRVPTDYAANEANLFFETRNGFREIILQNTTEQLIVIGLPLSEINHNLISTRNLLMVIGSAIFLIALTGGWMMVRKALRPIRLISQTAAEIASGDHSRRIQLAGAPTELISLARTLNSSFDHLDTALENQKHFSADASHELRTPVAVILAQTQAALKRDRSIEEYKTVLGACQRAGQRMKAMTASLLDLTRIDAHETELHLQTTDLNHLIAGAAENAAHLSAHHPVDIQGTHEPIPVNIDPERMHQVLMNLIRNSIQHNPAGCAIHLSLERTAERARIRVKDQGCGIPKEALPHIFDRFYRVDKSRSRDQGGTGLGLAIVKNLVEAQCGHITASSIEGQGVELTIEFVLAAPE